MSANLVRLHPEAKQALRALQSPGDADLYKELALVFIDTSNDFMKTLNASMSDAKSVRETAHSWKSSAAAIGAQILANLCEQLEKNPNEASTLIQKIADEYQAVQFELKKEVAA